jgi:NAD(P)-dependent dehydrogenase (short-subunit alcohol dehydrogenase family)
MDLDGRVAVVTGGSSGIGLATCQRLRAAGAQVVDWGLLEGSGVHCDVTDPPSVDRALTWTVEHHGTPTLLVTSAGVAHTGPSIGVSMEQWDRVMDVNLRGTFLTARAVAAAMVAASLDGSLVFVASINGVLADPETLLYSVSKAGVLQMAKVLANELGPHGIRVNAIGPGPTETAMLAPALADDDYRQLVIDTTPLRQVGTPDHIAEAIVGTMQMDWVTGQGIMVDGGTTLVSPRASARNAVMASHFS